MANYNENNPTVNWTEDEKYEVCKWENKWLKDLTRGDGRSRSGRVCDSSDDRIFTTTEELNTAFQIDIEDRKETWKHLCHICDYATHSTSCLTNHLTVHGIGKPFKCEKCDKDFSQKANWKKHLKTHDQTASQFSCDICQRKFAQKVCLKQHTIRMHGKKTISCDQCSKMFPSVGYLNTHKKNVHVFNSFKCSQCDKKYKTKDRLVLHIKSIHEEKNFPCDLCDHVASQKGNLVKHKDMVHEKKKNWFCKACSFSSYHKHPFVQHMTIHTGEKPFKCTQCLTRFNEKSSLERHKKSVHHN